MRSEKLYLTDIVDAADAIERFVAGVSQQEFENNELLASAVLQKLTVIGEACARLPQAFRHTHPEVEWRDIAAFRNHAVNVYFSLDWSIVWVAATVDAPEVRSKVAVILATEYP
jgi:uncharacterized protein with HEPN domain